MKFDLTIHLDNWISSPYLAANAKVIEVIKLSGSGRARSEDKRHAALMAYLNSNGITLEQFRQWEKEAAAKWVYDKQGEIVIPDYQFLACLTAGCHHAPKAVALPVDQLRSLVKSTDLKTGRKKCDRLFERFVRTENSNQPRFHSDEVLEHVDARGVLTFDPDRVKVKKVEDLVQWALSNIGLGSKRKMGYGLGRLVSLTESAETPVAV